MPVVEIVVGVAVFSIIILSLKLKGNQQSKIRHRIDELSLNEREERKQQVKDKYNIKKKGANEKRGAFGLYVIRQKFDVYCYMTNMKISLNIVLIGLAVVVTIVGGLVYNFVGSMAMSIVASVGAAMVIYLIMLIRAGRAESMMLKQIPDSLDALVRSIKTGLPISEGVRTIADINQEPISRLFRDVDDSIRIGINIDDAFRSVVKKFPMTELNYLAISVSIQRDTGGNMSEILNGLSAIIREREKLKSKIKAMSSEARASASIIGSLPFVMAFIIWLIKPEYVAIFWQEEIGHTLAGIGLSSMAIGWMIIWKMVKFKF